MGNSARVKAMSQLRDDFLQKAPWVKANVFHALVEANDVKLLPEAYNQFLLTALIVYGCVTRAQVLSGLEQLITSGKLTPELINFYIEDLAHECDKQAGVLGRQLELIEETRHAPDVKH